MYEPKKYISILFLAYSLERGGAERQLVNLAVSLSQRGHKVSVALFKSGGSMEAELINANINIYYLKAHTIPQFIISLFRLIYITKNLSPDILHSYLPLVNVISGMMRPILGVKFIVWGVRSSFIDLSNYGALPKLADFLQKKLVSNCNLIITNSFAGANALLSDNYPKNKIVTIPNGIDIDSFKISPKRRKITRDIWGIGKDTILIGIVARLDPIKNHELYLDAAAILNRNEIGLKFICIGGGSEKRMLQLRAKARILELDDQVLWFGERSDMPSIMNALDLLCLTSISEGFPNVIAEAMACGVPCVVTAVGDADKIIIDKKSIVPPGSPELLANAIHKTINKIRSNDINHLLLRKAIVENYSINSLVTKSERVLVDLLI